MATLSNEKEVGLVFCKKRLELELSLEDVAQNLGSKVDIIEQLENGLWVEAMKRTYLPGLIKNYSKILGIEDYWEKVHITYNYKSKEYQDLNFSLVNFVAIGHKWLALSLLIFIVLLILLSLSGVGGDYHFYSKSYLNGLIADHFYKFGITPS